MVLSADPHIVGPDGTRGEVGGERVKSFEVLAQWQADRWRMYEVEYTGDAG